MNYIDFVVVIGETRKLFQQRYLPDSPLQDLKWRHENSAFLSYYFRCGESEPLHATLSAGTKGRPFIRLLIANFCKPHVAARRVITQAKHSRVIDHPAI